MEITIERYEELVIAEHNYKKLCSIINSIVSKYGAEDSYGLGGAEMNLLRCMACHREGQHGE